MPTIEEYEAEWGAPKNEYVFEVDAPNGKPMKFRAKIVNDMAEALEQGEKFKVLVTMLTKAPIEGLQEFAPVSELVAQTAIALHTILIEPELNILQALRWTRQRAPFVSKIMEKLSERTQETILKNEEAALTDAKNA